MQGRCSLRYGLLMPQLHLLRFASLCCMGLLLTGGLCRAQQDPQFSQFRFQPFLYNPAAAGSVPGFDLTALARAQWVGLEGAPQSQTLTGHLPLYGLSSGIGFSIWNDIAGVQRVTGFYAAYAYQVPLGKKSMLSLGVSGGGLQQAIDGNRLRAPGGSYEGGTIQHNDDFLPLTNVQDFVPDFGTGLWLQHERYRAGLSVTHLTAPDVTFELANGSSSIRMERTYYVTGAVKIGLGGNLTLEPGVQVKTDWTASMLDLNTLLYIRDNIWTGLSFRTYFGGQTDAVGGMIGAQVSERFGLGYAYDYTLSALNQVSTGSHELMVSYRVAVEKPKQGKRINNLRYLHY